MFTRHFAQYVWKQNLQHLIVHVTNHCNFRCEHCFIDFSPKRDLKLEAFRKLGKSSGPVFWLDIGGGEPFLRKDLTDILECFQAEVIQIPTNGSLKKLVLERVAEMKERISADVTISLSLDGLEERHNSIRGQKQSWDQVWDTYESLRSLDGIKVKINTVVSKENSEEILELMKFVRTQKPDFHSIILLRGEPINTEFGLPSIETLLKLGPEIFKILKTYDYGKGGLRAKILRNYHRYLWNTSLKVLQAKTQIIPCLAGKAHMVVMGNGDVSSCEMLPPVGNINQQDYSLILESQNFKDQLKSIENKECYCTHNCAMLSSILFRPASVTHLLSEKLDLKPMAKSAASL